MAGFLNNRHYLPTYGVFASVDPIAVAGQPATLNPLVYSRANPIAMSDPSGLLACGGRMMLDDGTCGLGANSNRPRPQSSNSGGRRRGSTSQATGFGAVAPEINGGGGQCACGGTPNPSPQFYFPGYGWVVAGLGVGGVVAFSQSDAAHDLMEDLADLFDGDSDDAEGDEALSELAEATGNEDLEEFFGLDGVETWGRPETLEDHFDRHGDDFGATSEEDYAQQASDFLIHSQERGLPTKIDSQGGIRIWDPETNTFGAYNPDGTTRTFFKPEGDPGAYWDTQPGELFGD